MPLNGLNYDKTDESNVLNDFLFSIQELIVMNKECRPCKKKAMEAGLSAEEAQITQENYRDFFQKYMGLREKCISILAKFEEANNTIIDIRNNADKKILEIDEKYKI